MTNKQEQGREAEIQHPTEEEIERARTIWNSGHILGLHVQAEDAIVAAGVLLAAARAREAALRAAAQAAVTAWLTTGFSVALDDAMCDLEEVLDSAPAEAGHEEGGAGEG